MKSENIVYPAKLTSCDNTTLKKTLYALDHERRFKMRELDTKKKQFLHEHCIAASRRNSKLRTAVNTHEIIQEKLERKREREKQSALELQSRSSEFIQELRVRPLSVLIKMENKASPVTMEDAPPTEPGPLDSRQPMINNKVLSLYQRGLEGVLRREREKRTNPFIQSVNTILENLRDEKAGDKRDPMRNFTRNILSKYAGLNAVGAETISEKSENVSERDFKENRSPSDVDENEDIETVDQKVDTEADEYLKTSKHSSKGLQLWARVRKEQNSICLLNKRECSDGIDSSNSNSNGATDNEVARNKISGRPSLNLNISKSRASPIKRISSTKPSHPKSPSSPSLPRTSRINNNHSPSPKSEAGESQRGRIGSRSQSANKSPSPSNPKVTSQYRSRYGGNSAENPKTKSNVNGKMLPTLAIEDVDSTGEPCHHTVIVVHNDKNDEPHTPIQWDQGHRYSLSDELATEDTNRLKILDKSNKAVQGDHGCYEDLKHNTLTVNQNNVEEASDDDNEIDGISISAETPISEGEELQTSALSTYSGSRMTSSAGTGTRSHSRTQNRKSRRLSVQTSGALRALSSVLSEQDKHIDRLENDASSYRNVVSVLADVANSVEEQAKKLDNVRRAAPGLTGRPSHVGSSDQTKEGDGRKMRRSSVVTPERRRSSFVTNEVYKFLERRSSSKTMTRRQTLSKLELKLLSQAPGEDTVGRRNSFSSHNSSHHRGSVDFQSSTPSSAGGSISGSKTDVAQTLLDLDRRGASRRHSMSAVSDRLSTASPISVSRLSNISEKDSTTGGADGGKTMRSYSWAPDVSETTSGHVLAMELLARNNRNGASRFRTVTHMLKFLGEEYRRQTASMMYEELRYCTYLRLAPHQIPDALKDSNVGQVFESEV